MGAGMEETYQLTSALRYLPFGKHVAILTDARFSGVSTGACIGHVSPEALAGGPIGKLRDGDLIQIVVDRVKLEGSVDLDRRERRARRCRMRARPLLDARPVRTDLAPDPAASRRHAALGGAAGRQRRHMGRLCLTTSTPSSRRWRPAGGPRSMRMSAKDDGAMTHDGLADAGKCLPDDHDRAELIGRVWRPESQAARRSCACTTDTSTISRSSRRPRVSSSTSTTPSRRFARAGPLPHVAPLADVLANSAAGARRGGHAVAARAVRPPGHQGKRRHVRRQPARARHRRAGARRRGKGRGPAHVDHVGHRHEPAAGPARARTKRAG